MYTEMHLSDQLQEKWKPVIEHPDLPEIKDSYKKAVTAMLLENQEKAAREEHAMLNEVNVVGVGMSPTAGEGEIAGMDPVLISSSPCNAEFNGLRCTWSTTNVRTNWTYLCDAFTL